MGPAVEVAFVFLALAVLVGVLWGFAAWARGTRDSDVALERNERLRAEALAEARKDELEEAQRAIDEQLEADGRVSTGHLELVEAARRAPPGGRLAAVARVLSARAADRRARRDAAAAAAPAGGAAPGPGAPDRGGGDSAHA